MDNTEAELVITKQRSSEVAAGQEELTLKEMIDRGFSKHHACSYRSPYRSTLHAIYNIKTIQG